MKTFSSSFQTVLLGILIVTLMLGTLGYAVLGIQQLDQRVEVLQQEHFRTENLKAQREALRNAPQQTEEQLEELDSHLTNLLTTPNGLDARLNSFKQLASSMGVEEDLVLDVKEQASSVGFIPFSMTIRGSLESGLDFTRELERLTYVFNVSEISVSGVSSEIPRQVPSSAENSEAALSLTEGTVEIQLTAYLLWKP